MILQDSSHKRQSKSKHKQRLKKETRKNYAHRKQKKGKREINQKKVCAIRVWLGLWYLTPLSTIFHLQCILWWLVLLLEKTGVPAKTTDLSQGTVKFHHIMLHRVHIAMNKVRTNNFIPVRVTFNVMNYVRYILPGVCLINKYFVSIHLEGPGERFTKRRRKCTLKSYDRFTKRRRKWTLKSYDRFTKRRGSAPLRVTTVSLNVDKSYDHFTKHRRNCTLKSYDRFTKRRGKRTLKSYDRFTKRR